MLPKLKVLFLCTGNSCRSQMAEGWAQAFQGDRLEPYSAGTAPGHADPRAVQVMREAGVDISGHRSKHLQEFIGVDFDAVVTVSGIRRVETVRKCRDESADLVPDPPIVAQRLFFVGGSRCQARRIDPHLRPRLEEFNEIDRDRLERLRRTLLEKGAPSVEIEIPVGSPTGMILECARRGLYSLIVMGSQGRGYLSEIFLGSVAHNIARRAPLPVLFVPALR